MNKSAHALNVAVVAYKYAVEVSPVIKNLCHYLSSSGRCETSLIVNKLYRNNDFSIDDVELINLNQGQHIFNLLKRLRINLNEDFIFIKNLKKILYKYDFVFACDYLALSILVSAGIEHSKIIYLSLEGVDYLKKVDKVDAVNNIRQCALRIIQNKDRKTDLENYLGQKLDFFFLPVAIRPRYALNKIKSTRKSDQIKIVYSGYFASWACLKDFLHAYKNSEISKLARLTLHGHFMGTTKYYEEITKLAKTIPNTTIMNSYIKDEDYPNFLDKFDIGVALYKDHNKSSNFDHLLNSSGKIATYLWSGLAVLTNITEAENYCPPFLYLNEITAKKLDNVMKLYANKKISFNNKALHTASHHYNIDRYLDILINKMMAMKNNG